MADHPAKEFEVHNLISDTNSHEIAGNTLRNTFQNVGSFEPFRPIQNSNSSNFESNVRKVTEYLLQTFLSCNPEYTYQQINNPRRAITKNSNHGQKVPYDNDDGDYILYVNDIIGDKEGSQYQIIDGLGFGTFGQVVKCRNIKTKEVVALKVIKSKPAYYNQALVEVAILNRLSKLEKGKSHIVKMKDSFVYRNHLCISFEILSVNLYELIKTNNHRGLSTNLIRMFVIQILNALAVLSKIKLIHCDLKPENILLKTLDSPSLKIIDFGSACHENQTVYTYIQSRFYRAPEVLLGLPYNSSIDMWSLGCIAAELFLGLPLFPGCSEYNQVSRIIELLGMPPAYMCDKGKQGPQYFKKLMTPDGRTIFSLKTMEEYMSETKSQEQPSKKYFNGTNLAEIINGYPIMRKGLSGRDIEAEMQNRRAFIDFLGGLLRFNPLQRWTPQQALRHPYITQKPFLEPFNPLGSMVPDPMIKVETHKTSSSADAVSPRSSNPPIPAVRRIIQTEKEPLPYQNMMGIIPAIPEKSKPIAVNDYHYQQVVGTFSEFQINSAPTNNLPGPSPDFPDVQQYSNLTGIRKSQSTQFSEYGSLPQTHLQSFPSYPTMRENGFEMVREHEIHPRHGDFGERTRIPSRIPSVSSSVDWEIFHDYDGSSYAGSFVGSYAGSSFNGSQMGSRKNSFVDMSPLAYSMDQQRRQSASFSHSPGQTRHSGFVRPNRIGSYSKSSEKIFNESEPFLNGRSFSKPGESSRAPYNSNSDFPGLPLTSPLSSRKAHKKKRSMSSLPPQSPDLTRSSYFSPQDSQFPQNPITLLPSSERRPSLLDLNSSALLPPYGASIHAQSSRVEGPPFSTSKPIDLPNKQNQQENQDD